MYNDYYLQSIDSKLTITNNRLLEIEENQETLISGDNEIKAELQTLNVWLAGLTSIVMIILIYNFIVRCFR